MTDARRPIGGILAVDDEEGVLAVISRTLEAEGLGPVMTCSDSRLVADLLEKNQVSLMLVDLVMPHLGGIDLLKLVSKQHPGLPVIVATADADVSTVVACMKMGAVDYVTKPLSRDPLVATVRRALEEGALRYECDRLREQFFEEKLRHPECFGDIITADPAMLRMFGYLEAIAHSSQPVLVSGETGTGKELVARALHSCSGRSGPFVAVNVAGVDDATFTDTLFGHKTGAFTGATAPRKGLAEAAGTGILFLDEIGDLSDASQVKLLRVLQENEYLSLGDDRYRPLRARIVAATNRDVSCLREDLYYRLASYHVKVPPLRDRLGDLPLLVDRFLEQAAVDLRKTKPTVPPELYVYLANYDFPGNVRELRAIVFDAVAQHESGVMSTRLFLERIKAGAQRAQGKTPVSRERTLRYPYPLPTMHELQESTIAEAIKRAQGNQSAAAQMLGVSRVTVARYAARQRRS
ncbi:MAG: sigma-54-dependent Fis family transcriptional regulator [Deltaproteobacteria bacterium]|nr:sigma-54-dependent Fis family transcriptional regulator [Deltaproteobacteria bacterium]